MAAVSLNHFPPGQTTGNHQALGRSPAFSNPFELWLQRTGAGGTPAPAADLDADLVGAGAEALGGALEIGRSGDVERVVLRLPRNQAP